MKVFVESRSVEDRLGELGLTREALLSAVEFGEKERVSCTSFHPLSSPGSNAWGGTVARLRQLLVPKGWRQKDKSNLPLVVEPKLRVAIAVTSGTKETGDPDPRAIPGIKHRKGPMTQVQVEQNQRCLFGEEDHRFLPTPEDDETLTWFLLVYSTFHPRNDQTGDHVATCELSLPAAINELGKVTRWAERIVLGEIRLDDVPRPDSSSGEEDGQDIVVRVTRKES